MTAPKLTEREREILGLIGAGLTNRQIAARLSLEQSTVRWYARQIYARLGAADREEAVAQAQALGLVEVAAQPAEARHNLPGPTTPFVGRARELARLEALLADPDVRLVSLIGPGGMGKTRLALAAAENQLQPQREAGGKSTVRYPDGVWFIALAPIANARFLAPTIAEALGLQLEQDTGRDALTQCLDYLRQKRALLVVDNFEHLVNEAPTLQAIATAARGVQLLVTSRERLQLPGEQVLPLEGLEQPDTLCDPPASLADFAAAQLFLNTARRVQPDLALTEADSGAVIRICQAVAGMPLAIELAASWASVLPISVIAKELEGSLALLTADSRGLPERHRSMQAALAASWQRLTTEQQAAFSQLCVFGGGFTRAAAFEVTGATLPLLVTLVNKSWLTYDRPGDRYHVHELLRQYGQLKLSEAVDLEQAARERHSAYYAARLAQRAGDFRNARQRDCVSELQTEQANLEQAWTWAVQTGDARKIDQGVESLARFYLWVGRPADGEAALRKASEALAAVADTGPAQAGVDRILARTLIWQSMLTTHRKGKLEALEAAQDRLGRWSGAELDLRADRAFLLLGLADYSYDQDRRSAAAYGEQALALYQSIGDRAGTAACRLSLGMARWARGQLDEAAQDLEASLAIRRDLADQQGVADVLDTLGLVRKHQGRPAEAERLHREALDTFRKMGSRLHELWVTGDLAYTLGAAGRYAEMLALAQHASTLATDLGGFHLPFCHLAEAFALQHHGRYAEARTLMLAVLEMAPDTNRPMDRGFALCWLGQLEYVLGNYGQALQLLTESAAILAKLEQNALAVPVVWLSLIHRVQGEAGKARRALSHALRLTRVQRSYQSLCDCLQMAALLTADSGELELAAELHALCKTIPHIANSRWYYDVTGRQLDEVIARLPAEVAELTEARGRKLDKWQAAEALASKFDAD